MSEAIYHEKQVKGHCALHTLNNLLQDGTAFQKKDLDEICQNLDPNSRINQHKSMLPGWGDYDINVLQAALDLHNYKVVWFDKRKNPNELVFANIFGFILNLSGPYTIGWMTVPFMKERHWIAIRKLPPPVGGIGQGQDEHQGQDQGQYYNLDSNLESPKVIGTEENLIEYFRQELHMHASGLDCELMIVVSDEVERNQSWRLNTNDNNPAE